MKMSHLTNRPIAACFTALAVTLVTACALESASERTGESEAAVINRTTANVLDCTAQQLSDITSIGGGKEGAWVADRRSEYQGKPWQDGIVSKNYLSRSTNKQTFCGTLDRFGYADDKDWNLHLIPTRQPYIKLMTDIDSSRTQLEAEIAVDTAYSTRSPWFNTTLKTSPLTGRNICVYGALVADEWHEGDPKYGGKGEKGEIHPAEFIWWTQQLATTSFEGRATGPQSQVQIMHLQDNSERFDDRDNFDWNDTPPADWAPWADAPRKGIVRIPWSWRPGQGANLFAIYDDYVHRVVTPQQGGSADSEATNPMRLTYNGAPVVEVHEKTSVDANLGVNIQNTMCRRPNSTEILGLISIIDDISTTDDSDGEGAHVFRVLRARLTP